MKINNSKTYPTASSNLHRGMYRREAEMQRKELRKEWMRETPTAMDGSWEPVCAVRDKPEKQNLVCLGRGGGESCFQVGIHIKIAVFSFRL